MSPFRVFYQALVGTSFWTISSIKYLSCLLEIKTIFKTEFSPLRNSTYRAFVLSKIILYFLIMVFILQTFIMTSLLFRGVAIEGHLPFDPLVTVSVKRYPSLNYFTLVALGLIGFYPLYIDYTLSFATDRTVISLAHQLSIGNLNDFFACNSQISLPKMQFRYFWASLSEWRHFLEKLWHPLNFTKQSLKYFPNISLKTQTRLVVLTVVYERLFGAFALIVVMLLLMMLVLCGNILFTEPFLPFYLALFGFINAFLIVLTIWYFIKLLTFLLHYVLLLSFLTRSHMRELNGSLTVMLFTIKNRPAPSGVFWLLDRKLSIFYAEHRRLQAVQQTVNRSIASNMLLGALLGNVLLQVVLLNNLQMKRLLLEEKAVIAFILPIQLGIALTTCKYLISWTDSLYSSGHLLFIAQGIPIRSKTALLYPRILSVKMKLDVFYELLCTKKELRFTLGSFGEVSRRTFVGFFITYTGFFMYISTLMRKLHVYSPKTVSI